MSGGRCVWGGGGEGDKGKGLYTAYAGLEIPVDSAVALRPGKTAMLVLNCTGAYGRNAVFGPSRLVEAMQ